MGGCITSKFCKWAGIFARHRKKCVFTGLAVASLVLLATNLIERQYTASVVVSLPEAGRIGFEQDLTDPEVLTQIAHKIPIVANPDHGPASSELDQLIASTRARIVLTPVAFHGKYEHIQVSYTDIDPQRAHAFVNRLVDIRVEADRNGSQQPHIANVEHYEQRVQQLQRKLEQAELKTMRFEAEHPNLHPEALLRAEARLNTLTDQLSLVSHQINLTTEKRKALSQWARREPEHVVRKVDRTNPQFEQQLRRRQDLADQLFTLKNTGARMTDMHPQVINLRQVIDELDKRIAGMQRKVDVEGQRIPNAERRKGLRDVELMGGELKALETERDELNQQIQNLRAHKTHIVQLHHDYKSMLRDTKSTRKQLEDGESKLFQITIAAQDSDQSTAAGISVVERHRPPPRSSFLRFGAVLLVCVGFGLLASLTTVVTAHRLDDSFHDAQQVADTLTVPLLGTVNEIGTGRRNMLGKIFTRSG